MPTAEQIKSLIKAHFEPSQEKFTTISLQIAAHEARLGHKKLADDLVKFIDKSKEPKPKLIKPGTDLSGLIIEVEPYNRLSDMILPDKIVKRIRRIEREFLNRDKLFRHDLKNRRKILFCGPSGTGKTMTAHVLAKELNFPLHIILIDKLVTKFMGETGAKLRQVFDFIKENRGVYLFDEFDAIGTERSKDNDVGEMRRVLNAFLQFFEQDDSDSLILAATNNVTLLDQALFRRFDDIIQYRLPDDDEKTRLIDCRLGFYKGDFRADEIISELGNLSHAEITQACDDAVKEVILSNKQKVQKEDILLMIEERKSVYKIK
jgi:SpoVK/Ycf46/Vps4 family AAA+-type ATPase